MAISIASEPLGAKRTLLKLPGAIADNFSASATAGSQVKRRGQNGKSLHLLTKGRDQARVSVSNVMDAVAMEVHVAASRVVFNPNPSALRIADRQGVDTDCFRNNRRVAVQQLSRSGVIWWACQALRRAE